jgi:dTDP-4-amino-4,6-dideoxygalactose transaminase
MSRAAIHALHVSLGAHAFELDRRRAAAERLLERARRSEKVDVIEPVTGAAPGYLRLPMLANGVARSEALRTLDSHGAAAAYPAALASLRPFRERVLNPAEEFSGARRLVETLFTFPTHGLLGAADLGALEGWLDAAPQRAPSWALVSRERPAELRR